MATCAGHETWIDMVCLVKGANCAAFAIQFPPQQNSFECPPKGSSPASETKKSRFRNQNVRFRNQNDSETKMTDSATKTEAFQNQNVPVQKQKKRNSETKTYDSETKMYDSETTIYDLETKTWLPPPLTTSDHYVAC